MTRGGLAICLVLAAAGCGGGGVCTEGCQKLARCQPGSITNLEQCVAECQEDPGNLSIARCLAESAGCDPEGQGCVVADSTCSLATRKINDCMTAGGTPGTPLRFVGWCNDQAKLASVSSVRTVAFRAWSTTYLACTIDPKTCKCPGQPWYTEL